MSALDLLEVPRDEESACGRDDARLVDVVAVVELGGSEVNAFDLILDDVLRVDGQLHGLRLVLRDRLREARDAVVVLRGQHQDVGLASRQDPLLVLTHIDRLDRLTQTRQHRLRYLAHLLVHSDVSIGRSNNESTIKVGTD